MNKEKKKILWAYESSHNLIKSKASKEGVSIADFLDKVAKDDEKELVKYKKRGFFNSFP